jgi:hypothetical protein
MMRWEKVRPINLFAANTTYLNSEIADAARKILTGG